MALLMVVLVLVALLLIALPFAASMQMQQTSANAFVAGVRARQLAETAANHAVAQLARTNEAAEAAARDGRGGAGGAFNDPQVDSRDEFVVDFTVLENAGLDPSGLLFAEGRVDDNAWNTIFSALVEDEQSKINLNSATVLLLGNLLGAAQLAADLTEQEKDVMVVDDFSTLATDPAHPENSVGWLWVTRGAGPGELISFKGLAEKGEQKLILIAERTRGGRPEFRDQPGNFKKGDMVIDYRAYKAARHKTLASQGAGPQGMPIFDTPVAIKRIADYDTLCPGAESILPHRYRACRDLVTVNSDWLTGHVWINPETIKGIYNDPDDQGKPTFLRVEDSSHFNPGSVVRLVGNGAVEYAIVRGSGQDGQITLDRRVTNGRLDAYTAVLEMYSRHPVNVNTASFDTLRALFYGLRLAGREALTWDDATFAAQRLILRTRLAPPADPAAAASGAGGVTPPAVSAGQFVDFADLRSYLTGLIGKNADFTRSDVDTILLNAERPWSRDLIASTAPFSFHSGDVFTIEGRAAINDPAGNTIASRALRRIVQIGPDYADKLTVRTRAEFERPQSRLRLANLVKAEGDTAQGWIRRETFHSIFRDKNGQQGVDNGDGEVAGGATAGNVQVNLEQPGAVCFWYKPLRDFGAGKCFLLDGGEALFENRVSLYHDGRFGALVLAAADSTLERSQAEARFHNNRGDKRTLKNDLWYHLFAAWSSTNPGGLALMVDGLGSMEDKGLVSRAEYWHYPDGEDPVLISGHLAGDLPGGNAGGQVRVEEGAAQLLYRRKTPHDEDVPEAVVRVGDEAISIDGSGRILARGVRGTQSASHPDGALVAPFGYTDGNRSDVTTGNGVLDSNLDDVYWTELDDSTRDPRWRLPGLSEGATSVRVTDASKFQQSGYLLIVGVYATPVNPPGGGGGAGPPGGGPGPGGAGGMSPECQAITAGTEIARYTSRTNNTFDGLSRGELGTTARFWRNGWTFVMPISLAVKPDKAGNLDYPAQPKYLQVYASPTEYEWFRYDTVAPGTGATVYFVADQIARAAVAPITLFLTAERRTVTAPLGCSGLPPIPLQTNSTVDAIDAARKASITAIAQTLNLSWRQQLGTKKTFLRDGSKVMPVFQTAGSAPGRWDVVTLATQAHDRKEEHTINHVGNAFAALQAQVTATFPAGGWLLKFPTGALPRAGSAGTVRFNGTVVGDPLSEEGRAALDFDTPQWQAEFYRLGAPLDQDGSALSLLTRQGQPARNFRGGVVLIEGEALGAPGGKVMARGYLGTTARGHDGSDVIAISARTRGLVLAGSDNGGIIGLSGGQGLNPRGGYALVEDEMVGHTEIRSPQPTDPPHLFFPAFDPAGDPDTVEIWRGSFGTRKKTHGQQALVLAMPHRYHDRQADRAARPEMVYYETAFAKKNAIWKNVTIEIDQTSPSLSQVARYHSVRVLARTDGGPPWNTTPTNQPGGIWRFDVDLAGKARQVFDLGDGVRADTLELRLTFPVAADAFRDSMFNWTPKVTGIEVACAQRHQVLVEYEVR
ncbi:MAG: hypothetical protein HY719_09915 [Planctomycetes bacterium]|nr:hypothetical protein [Planctomycetota bacterium]